MLGDSQPPPVFWNTCSYFFWHRNNHKKIKIKNTRKTQMLGYLPKRDIKVPPALLVNHHDLFILTCCYQKSYLIFFLKKWKAGFGEGVDTGDLNWRALLDNCKEQLPVFGRWLIKARFERLKNQVVPLSHLIHFLKQYLEMQCKLVLILIITVYSLKNNGD